VLTAPPPKQHPHTFEVCDAPAHTFEVCDAPEHPFLVCVAPDHTFEVCDASPSQVQLLRAVVSERSCRNTY
jgi:hypothetical protein